MDLSPFEHHRKIEKKRKKKKKKWIQYLVWGYNVGNVTWDLGEHWLLLVASPETLVCYFSTRVRFGIVCLFCFVARRLLWFGASATIFLPCLCVFEGQFLAFYTALLSLAAPISFYWIIAPPFLPTKCFFCFSYGWWDKRLFVCFLLLLLLVLFSSFFFLIFQRPLLPSTVERLLRRL